MSKKSILAFLLLMVIILGGVSLYSTFAYDADSTDLEESTSDYNLIYSIKDLSNNRVYISSNETKFVDVEIINTYTSNVKYAMYYELLDLDKLPDNVKIELSDSSEGLLSDILTPSEKKIVTLKVTNNSLDDVGMVIGSVVGFENGNIVDLLTDKEVLIK